MTRIALSLPIVVDGRRVDNVDVAWPENADTIGLLGVSDHFVQIARTVATLTNLPLTAVYQMAFDDWQTVISHWESV